MEPIDDVDILIVEDNPNIPVRILFVEDLLSDAELAQLEIKKGGVDFVSFVVDTEDAFCKALVAFQPDVIVSDYSMPQFDGLTALQISKSTSKEIPFIVLTGSMNEETAVNCMKAGANDYVLKENITRLPFAIKEAIENVRSKYQKELLLKQLEASESMFRVLQNLSGRSFGNLTFSLIAGHTWPRSLRKCWATSLYNGPICSFGLIRSILTTGKGL